MMQHFFFDSSALAKRYIPEAGTAWVRQITNMKTGFQIVISEIALVEISNAIARRRSEGRFSSAMAVSLVNLLMRHASTHYRIYPLDDDVIAQAQQLSLDYAPKLRSLDAIQLACAILMNQSIVAAQQPPLTFVCADTRLLTVAAAEGMTPLDPNTMT